MLRYLTFSEEQQKRSPNPLEDYELAEVELLPIYFGSIATVNIFLGENNSGKSRFMREIMRSEKLKTISIVGEPDTIINQLSSLMGYLDSNAVDILINIELNISNLNNFRNDTKLLNIFGFDGYNTNSYWSVDVKNYIDRVKVFIFKAEDYFIDIKSSVELFFSDKINILLDEISVLEEDGRRISRIFYGISSTGQLGENFGHHYISSGYRTAFSLSSAFLTFNRYPWNNEHDTTERDRYSIYASRKMQNILQTMSLVKKNIDTKMSSITSPAYRTYIPTLRTARTLITQEGGRLESTNDIFLHTTVHDYNLKETGVTVDTGFGLYDAIDTTRNARHEGRTSFKDFERFLSATFFNGKDVEVVAERVRDQRGGNIIVAVEGVERDIHHLGDGIQAIIMLLYPLFIAPEKAWFFIEEPEVHLHPGFQRLFIETITSNPILQAKQLTIFLTTHSNHLLDFALDDPSYVSIFTFRRREGTGNKSTYQIQLSSQRDIENLNALGVQNTSVFLANCSIWVEGISDRLYFRAYLHAYLAELATRQSKTVSLLEGLHYTFLEYAGGNVTHFDFTAQDGRFTPQTIEDIKALSISNRILLVADRDAGKDTRHQSTESKQHNAFKYEILPVREVENLLSPALLAKGLKKLYSSRDFDPAQLIQADYRISYIGKYLQDQYGGFPASFTADSGTIKNKRKLAEVIIPGLTWSEMSPAAQKFTKTLYDFIIAHNPRLGSN
ncbi:MAG: ATP-dependent nuclease [Janthinobacterium lividum]